MKKPYMNLPWQLAMGIDRHLASVVKTIEVI